VFDGRFRSGVDRAVKPIGGALKWTGLSPDHLTALGLLLAFPAAAAIATGHLGLGLGLLIASGLPDLLDGALAKASGRASARGAFFDSVADRVTDTVVLGGVAWYLLDRYHNHVALLPMAVLGASLLISYERAKAESLGFDAKGGLMERAERLVVLCVGLAFSVLLIPILWLMLVLTVFTAVQRFVKVWRQATAAGHGPPPAARPAFVRRSGYASSEPAAVAARWRAWREANGWVPRSARYADGSHRNGTAARWQERRRARLARLRAEEGQGDVTSPTRRRSGSRRP
jgi:CDP-diacylglycerol--glycerol-3-phosphate 3-phosphatidyltransferase